MEDVTKIINKFDNLDMDNYMVVKFLADDFIRWLHWNKAYEKIEVFESRELNTIIVAHSLFSDVRIIDSWQFLEDVKYCLTEYVNHEMEDEELHDLYFDDVYSFWNNNQLFNEAC